MGGEDFAKYQVPYGLLFLDGGLWSKEDRFPQNRPYFRIDEKSLDLGVRYFVQYVLEYQDEE